MKIVILAGDGKSSDIVYNSLSKVFDVEKIIIEHGVGMPTFIKRRIKKLGLVKVIGQILFSLIIVRKLKKNSKDRITEILNEASLDSGRDYRNSDKCVFVNTVNDDETVQLLKELSPDVVIVNGTGIIKKHVLDCCNAVFINMHTGITPKYRGVHGAYWALVNNDKDNCGVTIHLVDEGIDTGNIIYQGRIEPTEKDNFVTYPYLQTAKGVELEIQAIKDVERGALKTCSNELESKLWTHPTLREYIVNKVK